MMSLKTECFKLKKFINTCATIVKVLKHDTTSRLFSLNDCSMNIRIIIEISDNEFNPRWAILTRSLLAEYLSCK